MQVAAKTTFTGKMAATALAAAAIATAGLGSTPQANATCASFFGINSGGNCTSSFTTIAIAIGQNAQAHADGVLGAALSFGDSAISIAQDALTLGVAAGDASYAAARGVVGLAQAIGPYTTAQTQGLASAGNLGVNIALNFSPLNQKRYEVLATGLNNLAINFLGTNDGATTKTVGANGVLSIANNIGGKRNNLYANGSFLNVAFNNLGDDNTVSAASGSLSNAFNLFGSNNVVSAGPGPLAIAGAIFGNFPPITKLQFGININGFKVPNTAAAVDTKAPSAAKRGVKPSAAVSSASKPAAAKPTAAARR